MIKSCYIHIPFCERICSYCDFCKEYYNKRKVEDYLDKLKQEVLRDYKKEVLDTIYIGGGTPTCLDIKELEVLFSITDTLQTSNHLEFTIEGNIESITKDKLELMRKHKVNRVSIGIESINQNNLSFLERNHKEKDIRNKIQLIRECGFSNINVDLIYAIPNETINILKKDLEFILSLKVEHISTYSLIIEDHTKLGIKRAEPIKEELDNEMYKLICNTLKDKNYIHYEISNFAKEGYESKHNKCYWLNEEYYGFGLGASSYTNSIRKTNTRSLTYYPKVFLEKEELNEEDKIEYELILNLRLLEGINLNRFREKYKKELIDIYNYKELVNKHLLIEENDYLRIPEELLYVSNEIMVKVLQTKKV